MAKECLPAISRCNNMNVVRYYLAISVLIAHYNLLTGHSIPWPTSSYTAVGGFFALSGYLMFHSYIKQNDLRAYITNRVRRLLPPYVFIVVICAIGLVTVSSLPATEYFRNSGFIKYLAANLTFMNFLHPTLPGVFEGRAFFNPAVNGSLWTMKIEWLLYLSVPAIYYLYKRFRWNNTTTFVTIIALSVAYRLLFYHMYINTGNITYSILSRQFFGQLCYFYTGVIVYFHFDNFLKYKWRILIICIIAAMILQKAPYYSITLQPFVDAILTLWISLVGSWGYKLGKHDNISYDIYLFHYPIIQVCVWAGISNATETLSFTVIAVLTIILSILSWKLVGSRFVKK